MDAFEQYLMDLGRQNPYLSALVEAVSEGCKICHSDDPSGKCESGNLVSHHPCAANPLYTVPFACTEAHGAASKLAENVRPSHKPLVETNPGVCMSHVDTSVFVESKDTKTHQNSQERKHKKEAHVFTYSEIVPKMQVLLNNQQFFNKLMKERDLLTYRNVWLHSGICSKKSEKSAYTYFRPAQNTSIYDVLRITDHQVILGRVRKGSTTEISLQFDNDNLALGKHGTHEDENELNKGKTKLVVWHFHHQLLRRNYYDVLHGRIPGIVRSYKETQIYKIFAEILRFFETGMFNAPFVIPTNQESQSKGESKPNTSTTNNGKANPLTDAVNQHPLTNLGESVMNTYQKSYTAFMESVCKQFNCREALPALKEGFKAFCEASEASVPMTMEVEKTVDTVPDASGNMRQQEVVYVKVNDTITVRSTQSYCEILEHGHIIKTMPFDYSEARQYDDVDLDFDAEMGIMVEHKMEGLPDENTELDMVPQEVVEVQLNTLFTVRITKKYCEILEYGHIIETTAF